MKRNYKYNIEKLRKDIFKALILIKKSTILDPYKSYLKKIKLCKKKINKIWISRKTYILLKNSESE